MNRETQQVDQKSLRVITGARADFSALAADCVCFANASGGCLRIGIEDGAIELQGIDVVGFADLWLDIPAGEGAHVSGQDFKPTGESELIAVAPHMHLLGQRIRADLVRADGTEECLVDIPDWDFQWQAAYFFPDGQTPALGPGDTLRLRCTYDNSEAGQPTDRPPETVGWGDGTYD